MARKSFNGRLAAILLVPAVVAAVGVHLVHGRQMRRTAVTLLDRAEKAEAGGQLDRAEDYLGRYLAYRPADVDCLVRLGGLLEKRASTAEDRQKVVAVFEKANRLDRPARPPPALGQIAGRRRAIHRGQGPRRGPRGGRPPGRRDGHPPGAGRGGDGPPSGGRGADMKARLVDPTAVNTYLMLANLLRRRLGDPGRADAVMDARGEAGG